MLKSKRKMPYAIGGLDGFSCMAQLKSYISVLKWLFRAIPYNSVAALSKRFCQRKGLDLQLDVCIESYWKETMFNAPQFISKCQLPLLLQYFIPKINKQINMLFI